MDGPFYVDLREPFFSADASPVTLATTYKALYTASAFPVLGGQYFARVGKKMRITLFGKMTTAATPGNGSFKLLYGTGADANGVALVTGTPVALTASQTDMSWWAQFTITCRSTGSTGTLMVTGIAVHNEAVLAPHQMIPTTAAVVSGACDLTTALIISVQYARSGNTAETMTVQEMTVEAMN